MKLHEMVNVVILEATNEMISHAVSRLMPALKDSCDNDDNMSYIFVLETVNV